MAGGRAPEAPTDRRLAHDPGRDARRPAGDPPGPGGAWQRRTGRAASTSSGRTSATSSPTTGRWSRPSTARSSRTAPSSMPGSPSTSRDLFVEPERLGQGIGRPLLTALLRGHDRTARPSRPTIRGRCRSTPGPGMSPLWVEPLPRRPVERRSRTSRDWTATPADPAQLAELERDVDGRVPAGRPRVLGDAGRGRSVRDQRRPRSGRRGLRTGPPGVRGPSPRPTGPATGRRSGRAVRSRPCDATGRGGAVHAVVPGPNPLLQALLERRFQVVDRDQYMASSADLIDPLHVLPNPGML